LPLEGIFEFSLFSLPQREKLSEELFLIPSIKALKLLFFSEIVLVPRCFSGISVVPPVKIVAVFEPRFKAKLLFNSSVCLLPVVHGITHRGEYLFAERAVLRHIGSYAKASIPESFMIRFSGRLGSEGKSPCSAAGEEKRKQKEQKNHETWRGTFCSPVFGNHGDNASFPGSSGQFLEATEEPYGHT
jgi:hypothetical protein